MDYDYIIKILDYAGMLIYTVVVSGLCIALLNHIREGEGGSVWDKYKDD